MGLEPLITHPPANPYPLLALDLSTRAVGWASIPHPGIAPFTGSARPILGMLPDTLDNRLRWLGAFFADWIGSNSVLGLVVVEVPDLSAATGQGMTTTPETLRALYQAAGVVRECCRRAGVPMAEVDARRVRERIVGKKTADKAAVQQALARRGYRLPRRGNGIDHDAADGLALGVAVMDELAMLAKVEG